MTRYELLTTNQSTIQILVENSIDIRDIEYLSLINEFRTMKAKKEKVGYIVSYLSDKYGKSERGIYKIT